MKIRPTKVFILWIWATFFIPFIVWPQARQNEVISSYLNSQSYAPAKASPSTDLDESNIIPLPDQLKNPDQKQSIRLSKTPYLPKATFTSLEEAFIATEKISAYEAESRAGKALQLFLELIQTGKNREAEIGSEKFREELDGGEVKLRKHPSGKAELNSVDKIKFQKIIPLGSQTSVIFLNNSLVDKQSSHLHKIIACQHIDGGSTRLDDENGRDVLIVWYENGNEQGFSRIDRVEYFPRHPRWTKEWAKDEVLATWTAPSLERLLILGVIMGSLLQAHQVIGLNELGMLWGKVIPISTGQVLFTLGFGGAIGVLAPTIRKLVTRPKSDLKQLMRNIVITSAPFAIAFKLLDPNQGPAAFQIFKEGTWLPFESIGWLTMGGLAVHFVSNNLTKVQVAKAIKLLNREQKNVKRFFDISLADWQTQGFNLLVSMPSRLLDLSGALAIVGTWHAVHYEMPGGKVLLISLWPAVMYGYTLLAEHLKTDNAEEIRKDWERHPFGFLLGLPIGTFADLFKTIAVEDDSEIRGHLEDIAARWNRQKWAPWYHTGRVLDKFGRILAPKTEKPSSNFRSRCAGALSRVGTFWQTPFLMELDQMAFAKP
ncbi:MAG: hypothetical protein JWQ35_576 [Bacteriovoracaceae bacterium]|nr:hypothetical protein [Bacteriovoracaceae bacterium]